MRFNLAMMQNREFKSVKIIFSRPFQKLTGKNSKDKFFQPFQYSTTHNLENIITSRDGFH